MTMMKTCELGPAAGDGWVLGEGEVGTAAIGVCRGWE
jgi:hypothetical protein